MRPGFWRLYFRVYDRLNKSLPYQRLLEGMTQELRVGPAGKYLDIGCGTGNSTYQMARQAGGGGLVVGIDSSREALEIAGAKRLEEGVSRPRFERVDLDGPLPYDTAWFDGAMASNSLYLVRDPAATLAEVARVLTPGGYVVMTNPKAGASPWRILADHLRLKRAEYQQHHGPTAAYLLTQLHAAKGMADFLALLPFQVVLKNSGTMRARFWDREQWGAVLAQVRPGSGPGLDLVRSWPDYSGQNHTFLLQRR